jgi:DUF1365 family protein
MLRAKSTIFTAGIGNSTVATAELGGAFILPMLALAAPLIALGIVMLLLWLAIRLLLRLRASGKRDATSPQGRIGR